MDIVDDMMGSRTLEPSNQGGQKKEKGKKANGRRGRRWICLCCTSRETSESGDQTLGNVEGQSIADLQVEISARETDCTHSEADETSESGGQTLGNVEGQNKSDLQVAISASETDCTDSKADETSGLLNH
nr:uncharacterized protein LOC131772978 [Pocillopora verrucosa]